MEAVRHIAALYWFHVKVLGSQFRLKVANTRLTPENRDKPTLLCLIRTKSDNNIQHSSRLPFSSVLTMVKGKHITPRKKDII